MSDLTRESVDEVLEIVGTYGPWGPDINESLRFQIVLAEEVKALRGRKANLSPQSLVEWASAWVPESNRARFADALKRELAAPPEGGLSLQPTTPWDPKPKSAPVANALVLKVTDYPELAAEKVKGEVPQLQAGVVALFEGVREVGLQAVRFELLLRAVMQCDKNANILGGARDLRERINAELAFDMNVSPERKP